MSRPVSLSEDDSLRIRIAIVKLTGMVDYLRKRGGISSEWDPVLVDALKDNFEALRLLDPEGTRGLDQDGLLTYANDIWALHVRGSKVSRAGFEGREWRAPEGPQRGEA